jgi:hypothetical protein
LTAQLSLAYRPAHVGREAWLVQLEAIRAAVYHLGHKEVAYELDVAGSYLSDALNERDRKRWAAEWTLVVLAMLEQRRDGVSDALQLRILAASTELSPYTLAERIELSAEDLLAEVQRTPEGRAAVEAAQRKGRRR